MTTPEGSEIEYQEFLHTILPTVENSLVGAGVFQVLQQILWGAVIRPELSERYPLFKDKNFLQFLAQLLQKSASELKEEVRTAENEENTALLQLWNFDDEVTMKLQRVTTLGGVKSKIFNESDALHYSQILVRVLLAA